VFQDIGIATTAIIGFIVIGFPIYLLVGKAKGGTICLRRYQVEDPYEINGASAERRCWTLRGAARAARRYRGTRIFNLYDLSWPIAAPGWNERENGYYGLYISPHQVVSLLQTRMLTGLPKDLASDIVDRGICEVNKIHPEGVIGQDWLQDDSGRIGYSAEDILHNGTRVRSALAVAYAEARKAEKQGQPV
jgi:hypothetical protein